MENHSEKLHLSVVFLKSGKAPKIILMGESLVVEASATMLSHPHPDSVKILGATVMYSEESINVGMNIQPAVW